MLIQKPKCMVSSSLIAGRSISGEYKLYVVWENKTENRIR